MAKYRVRTKQFCAIAKEALWQSWLHAIAPDLFDELTKHLEKSTSCKANVLKMEQIQQELESRRLSQQMINFLMKEYPFAVEEIKEAGDVKPTAMRGQLMVTAHDQDVFEHYNPNLLTFPQRIIIKNDDPEGLKRDVNDFIINKVGVDYLIMDNMAFIEYFKLKYSAEAKMVALESRELYKYRQLHGIVPYQRIVSKNTIGGV